MYKEVMNIYSVTNTEYDTVFICMFMYVCVYIPGSDGVCRGQSQS